MVRISSHGVHHRASRRRKTPAILRWVIGLAVVGLVLLVGAVMASPKASAESPVNLVCTAAGGLIEDTLPRRALFLINAYVAVSNQSASVSTSGVASKDTSDSDSCPKERTAAQNAIAKSLSSSRDAQDKVGAKKWDEAVKSADAALKKDSENVEAQDARKAALGGQGAAQTKYQRLENVWKEFATNYLTPVFALLVPIGVLLASLLVLARLLVLLRWPALDTWRRPTIALGVSGMLAGALILSVGLADATATGSSWVTQWAIYTGAWVLGLTLMFALIRWPTLGTRRRRINALIAGGMPFVALMVLYVVLNLGSMKYHALAFAVIFSAVALTLLFVPVVKHLLAKSSDRVGWSGAFVLLSTLIGLSIFFLATPSRASSPTGPWTGLATALFGVTVAGVGVLLTGQWMATRLRLEVRVSDAKGEAKPAEVGHIIALLSELGAEKPRGLEVPRGADAMGLNDAFAILSENKILKTIQGIIAGFLGTIPWRVTVDVKDEEHIAVAVMRNGHAIGSTTIAQTYPILRVKKDVPGQGHKDPEYHKFDPNRMIASFILTAMAAEHSTLRDGLAGATEWRSVGLHSIAMADVDDKDNEGRAAVLGRALSYDPGNRSAGLAFQHALHRESTNATQLNSYRKWLNDYSMLPDIPNTLRLRARYTQLIVATNCLFADDVNPLDALVAAEATLKTIENACSAVEALDVVSHETLDLVARSLRHARMAAQAVGGNVLRMAVSERRKTAEDETYNPTAEDSATKARVAAHWADEAHGWAQMAMHAAQVAALPDSRLNHAVSHWEQRALEAAQSAATVPAAQVAVDAVKAAGAARTAVRAAESETKSALVAALTEGLGMDTAGEATQALVAAKAATWTGVTDLDKEAASAAMEAARAAQDASNKIREIGRNVPGLMIKAREANRKLKGLLDHLKADPHDDLAGFYDRIKTEVEAVQWLYGIGTPVSEVPTGRLSPVDLYHRACYFSCANDWPFNAADSEKDEDDERAVSFLRGAKKEVRVDDWMRVDPALRRFRSRTAYRNAFLEDPRTDFFDLPPIKPRAESLIGAGFDTVEQLTTLGRWRKARWSYLVPDVEQQLIISRLAHLRETLVKDLDRWAIEILHELITLGIAREGARIWRINENLAQGQAGEKVAEVIMKRCKPGDEEQPHLAAAVTTWIQQIAKPR